MKNRIYMVTGGDKLRLVRAPNAAQAIRHISKPYKAELPSQEELLDAWKSGVQVEDVQDDGE